MTPARQLKLKGPLKILWVLACAVGAFVSPQIGLVALVLISIGLAYIIDTETLHRIQKIGELRNRLITLSDNEFVLRDLKADQEWRGEPIDPRIEERLKEIELSKQQFQDNIQKAVEGLMEIFKPVEEPKKPESN